MHTKYAYLQQPVLQLYNNLFFAIMNSGGMIVFLVIAYSAPECLKIRKMMSHLMNCFRRPVHSAFYLALRNRGAKCVYFTIETNMEYCSVCMNSSQFPFSSFKNVKICVVLVSYIKRPKLYYSTTTISI